MCPTKVWLVFTSCSCVNKSDVITVIISNEHTSKWPKTGWVSGDVCVCWIMWTFVSDHTAPEVHALRAAAHNELFTVWALRPPPWGPACCSARCGATRDHAAGHRCYLQLHHTAEKFHFPNDQSWQSTLISTLVYISFIYALEVHSHPVFPPVFFSGKAALSCQPDV